MDRYYEFTEARGDGRTRRVMFVPVPNDRGRYLKCERGVETACPKCLAGPFEPCRTGARLLGYQTRLHAERRIIGKGRVVGSTNRPKEKTAKATKKKKAKAKKKKAKARKKTAKVPRAKAESQGVLKGGRSPGGNSLEKWTAVHCDRAERQPDNTEITL